MNWPLLYRFKQYDDLPEGEGVQTFCAADGEKPNQKGVFQVDALCDSSELQNFVQKRNGFHQETGRENESVQQALDALRLSLLYAEDEDALQILQ